MACWDTGAGLTAVDAEFARIHPHLFEPVRTALGVDASGVEMPTQIARMTSCRVGGIVFAPSACAFVDFGPLNAVLEQQALDENRVIQPMSFVSVVGSKRNEQGETERPGQKHYDRKTADRETDDLDVEAELHYVAVDGVVVLALDAELADVLGFVPGTDLEQVVPVDHFRFDETALKVGVDAAGTLRC